MIVKTTFGRVAVNQLPADPETWESLQADLLDLSFQYGQALWTRVETGADEPDITGLDPVMARRLIDACVSMPMPEQLGTGDLLRLINAVYEVNGLEVLGKMAARRMEVEQLRLTEILNRASSNEGTSGP